MYSEVCTGLATHSNGDISTRRVFPQWWSAALLALYDAVSLRLGQGNWHCGAGEGDGIDLQPYRYGMIPPIDPMLTMAPLAWMIISWKLRTMRMGPNKLMSNIRCTAATSVSIAVMV